MFDCNFSASPQRREGERKREDVVVFVIIPFFGIVLLLAWVYDLEIEVELHPRSLETNCRKFPADSLSPAIL